MFTACAVYLKQPLEGAKIHDAISEEMIQHERGNFHWQLICT